MVNFNNIRTAIDTYIKTNGSQEITGGVLNSVLNGIIDAVESVFSIFKKDLGDKVDKVDGKGLSTNDFSNDEKEKLATLQNYDDTALKKGLEGKQDLIADLANIRDGAAKGATALQSVPEEYVKDIELNKVTEKVSMMSTQIAALQKEVILLRLMIEEKPDVTSNVLGVAKVGYALLG